MIEFVWLSGKPSSGLSVRCVKDLEVWNANFGFFVMSISKVIFHFSCENVEKIMCIRTKYNNTLFKILFN